MEIKNVAVIGGAGFAGIELVRHILNHPGFNLIAVSSDSDNGKPLSELYPSLTGKTELCFVQHAQIVQLAGLDAVFLAVPHTAAMGVVPQILAGGAAVFDLSADYRLKDAAVYEQWYGAVHTSPALLDAAIYGLPEINRSYLHQKHLDRVQAQEAVAGASAAGAQPVSAAGVYGGVPGALGAQTGIGAAGAQFAQAQSTAPLSPTLIACPGCYPTASALAVAPALVADFVSDDPIIINAISGVSGAGRSANQTTHYCAADENINAYGVTTHRHTPEIAQLVAWEAGRELPVVFTPHLAPLKRGLLSTATLRLKDGVSADMVNNLYGLAYEGEPFVSYLPYGQMPRTASVVGTNCAHVGLAVNESAGVLIVSCAIDNLGKGAAAQAIQCANIVFGFVETSGLTAIPGVA